MAQVAHQPGDNPAETLQVVEERAVIRKRKNLTSGVRVRTLVREDEELIDALLHSEQAEVERVALDRWVEEPVPVRQEGATMVITLHEEVVVVEKRLRAIEEVRLTKRQTIQRVPQHVTLRREELVVEDLDPATGKDPD
ncbi:MAG TPA: YsnF/AvaK domain-containing protein [Geminicoccus sp.]|uniref:YsnF/AvaK domain-containing protein n=1 Tax=Geminicoccus sp. TaxID=2024832 RepID=UPI002B9B7439|nr:YsnF/AvaK domain-containing protein [Geminicoccus sp.]HWL71335.1 YsnF/AvaK domain-containing protein [Geminicoccus sp.]